MDHATINDKVTTKITRANGATEINELKANLTKLNQEEKEKLKNILIKLLLGKGENTS